VRQNLQAQQFGQEERIIGVIRMLDATVLCHPGGVGQHHRILARLQPVHQPVPADILAIMLSSERSQIA
jgi:hypothetical protein